MNASTSRTDRDPGGRAILPIALLFFLSGAGSLVYQIVWVRMLLLVFGTTVFAVSTVLAAFMAGLALGSVWFGRRIDRGGDGLAVYAALELGVGLFALLFVPLLAGVERLFAAGHGWPLGAPWLFGPLRFVLCFLLLLVPTTLMGGTLPVLSRFVVRHPGRIGHGIGLLYAVNTFGAVAGCAAGAFLLLEWLGIRGTILAVAATNLLIALAAFLLSRRARSAAPAPQEAAAAEGGERAPAPRPLAAATARAVFWGYAASGFAALGYEVLWTRSLSIVLRTTTTQSLSAILIVFLCGLALGGAVAARLVDGWQRPLRRFAGIELLLGLAVLASVAAFALVPGLLELWKVYSFGAFFGRLLVGAGLVLLLPTFLMGLLFPVAGRLRAPTLGSLGRRIGGIYAANTIGAVLGALGAGFMLLPLLGTQRGMQLLAWVNLAIGGVVLLLDPELRPRRRALLLGAAAIPAVALTLWPRADLLIDPFRSRDPARLLYHDEGAEGTVTVLEREGAGRLLKINGAGEVPTDHASIQIFRLLGSLPLLLHPDAEEVLVIALGGGVTLAAVERLEPRRIHCVELVPGVVGAGPFFAEYNNRIYERLGDGRVELIADDGRNHLRSSRNRYDVIISDSTHPATADSWMLYTRDFYELCRRRLDAGGFVAQWLPLHGLAVDDYKMIVRTFHEVFPHGTVWLNTDYSILLGAPAPLAVDFDALLAGLRATSLGSSLQEVNLGDPVSLLATLALDEAAIPAYVGDGPINTDDHAYINFGDRRRSNTAEGLFVLASLVPSLPTRIDFVSNATPPQRRALVRRLDSRRHMLAGTVALRSGDLAGAARELSEALRIDPSNADVPRVLDGMPTRPAAPD